MNNFLPPQMMRNLKGMATDAIGTMKNMGQMATEAEMVMGLVGAYKSGNLMPFLQKMAATNPQVGQALSIIQGKDVQSLAQMAQNMAAERGMTVDDIAKGLGLNK